MPTGKKWGATERGAVAKAWMTATHDERVGADQKAPDCWQKVLEHFQENAPSDQAEGTYNDRDVAAVKACFRKLAASIQKFNGVLRNIRAAKPTGVAAQNIVQMAVAFVCKKNTT